jgi:hypothetical protein
MYMHISIGFWIATMGSLAFVAAFLVWSLARGAATAGLSQNTRAWLIWIGGALLTAWAALDLVLASRGVFHYSAQYTFPYVALGILAPLVTGVLLVTTLPALRAAVSAIPQYGLIGIQGVRVLGVTFLILMAQHQLPADFALPAGIGDILVGIFALVLAREFSSGRRPVSAALVWNLYGILDLVSAVGIGFLASTTPFRLIYSTPTTDSMSFLPMVVIPVFGIPIFLLLHGISLAGLKVDLNEWVTLEAKAAAR